MQEIVKSSSFDKSMPLEDVRGTRVLTPSGFVFGRVASVRSDSSGLKILGFVVNASQGKVFVGREYFDSVAKEACMLKEEPALLLKDMQVLSHEGERVGRVKIVIRVKNTNEVDYLVVKGIFRAEYRVKPSHIASVAKSIILKGGVDVPKRSFWR
jgi:sporulation protein YlmC with PRC-barrel domain